MMNNNLFGDMFKGFNLGDMFGQYTTGYAKLSYDGKIAINVNGSYKVYDPKSGTLTNCGNFAFDVPGMFWKIPVVDVKVGDIIVINKQVKCVKSINDDNTIDVLNYANSSIEKVVREKHLIKGIPYFYSKVVCAFDPNLFGDSDKKSSKRSSLENIMMMQIKMQMLGSMCGGSIGTDNNMLGTMMAMNMLGGGNGGAFGLFDQFTDMFNGLLESDEEVEDEVEEGSDE